MLANLDFSAVFTAGGLAMLAQIIIADLTMAGDNVLIMGTLASGLPEKDRRKVILFGVSMALVFLIAVFLTGVLAPRADAAFPGANGKIAFASTRDGHLQIYVMNPDGTGQTRLTNNSASIARYWIH